MLTHSAISETANYLLAGLDSKDFQISMKSCERVTFSQGEILLEQETSPQHVYFLESGTVSLVQRLSDGAIVEIGVVGREGLVGTIRGGYRFPFAAIGQIGGVALQMPAEALLELLKQNPAFQQAAFQFTHWLFRQISQFAACNARHVLNERLARWLLMVHDRVDHGRLPFSHEFISAVLGVRRATVTVALGRLKSQGLISISHGEIVILDRQGLEAMTCECYRAVQAGSHQ